MESLSLPSSPPSLELGEFLDGLIFSPDGTSLLADEPFLDSNTDGVSVANEASLAENPMASSRSLMMSYTVGKGAGKSIEALRAMGAKSAKKKTSEASKSQANLKSDEADDESLVLPSETKPQDILCLRGNVSNNRTIMMFRGLISSNKAHYDTLTTTTEKESFSINLWLQLRDKGHRFLKPTASNDKYQILDYDQSTKKVHHALKHCRTKNKVYATDNDIGVAAMSSAFVPPKKKKKTGKSTSSGSLLKVKHFDDVANAAISMLLSRQELVNAMEKNWGEDKEKRRQIFEEQVG